MLPCTSDPDRWQRNDSTARHRCQSCPSRAWCATQAVTRHRNGESISGIWAGVWIPPTNELRARRHAWEHLESVAEYSEMS